MNTQSTSRQLVVLRLAGIVLLAAGSLKVATSPNKSPDFGGLLNLRAFGLLELGLAVWFLAGFWPRTTRWLALATFAIFLGGALSQSMRGETSCKCFGHLTISPWIMVMVDGSLVAGLLLLPATKHARARKCELAGTVSLVGLATAVGTLANLAGLTLASRHDGAVILTPSNWMDRASLIFEDADNGSELRHGDWLIMLHQSGCSACAEAMTAVRQRAATVRQGTYPLRIAIVELDPTAPGPKCEEGHLAIAHGQMRGDRQWIVRPPLYVRARDGRVLQVTERLEDVGS